MIMAKQPKTPIADETIQLGPVSLARSVVCALVAESFARNGVVLANERIKVNIPNGDLPCTYTLSLYVQRDPWDDSERDAVASTKEERDAAKKERELVETERLAREKRAAFQLGQESTMSALKNIGELAQGVRTLQTLTSK